MPITTLNKLMSTHLDAWVKSSYEYFREEECKAIFLPLLLLYKHLLDLCQEKKVIYYYRSKLQEKLLTYRPHDIPLGMSP